VLVRLYTDSQYLRDGITRWLPVGKARGCRTAGKTPVKNIDLWQRLETARRRTRSSGLGARSCGHPENERADALARGAIAAQLQHIQPR